MSLGSYDHKHNYPERDWRPSKPASPAGRNRTAVRGTAIQAQATETMRDKKADVPLVSRIEGNGSPEMIDSAELAARWRVPESWVRNRTRARTPQEERIPCIRLGRYVRFEWGSVPLSEWLAKKRA